MLDTPRKQPRRATTACSIGVGACKQNWSVHQDHDRESSESRRLTGSLQSGTAEEQQLRSWIKGTLALSMRQLSARIEPVLQLEL